MSGTSPPPAPQSRHPLVVKPPYLSSIQMFDDDKFFDVSVAVAGIEKPLKLHRVTLASTSALFNALFSGEQSIHGTYDDENKRAELRIKDDAVHRSVVMKWLRFCYGEEQTLTCEEYAAALYTLKQLELTCGNDVEKMIEEHMLEVAKEDIDAGILMLRSCATELEERGDEDAFSDVGMSLAKTLFTRDNLTSGFDTAVMNCLMDLPSSYLDVVEYGDDHTDFSEFSIRLRYVESHASISNGEKCEIMMKCRTDRLDSADLQRLWLFNKTREEEDEMEKLRSFRLLPNFNSAEIKLDS